MKVLLINGSPHQNGCVFTALSEIAETLAKEEVQSEIFWIGTGAIQGCVCCWGCRSEGADGCVFKNTDKIYSELLEKVKEADAFVFGSPVYYAGPNGSLCALMDRLFFSASRYLANKPAASVVNCRRGGASAAFDRLNKYFTLNHMPVVSSQYWNSTHGFTPDEVRQDLEGLQTMRSLARNMAYLLKTAKTSGIPLPEKEEWTMTNFIS